MAQIKTFEEFNGEPVDEGLRNNSFNYQHAFITGAMRMREIMLNRTCEWIFSYISKHRIGDKDLGDKIYEEYEKYILDNEKEDFDELKSPND